jgi:hypothetical protein
VSWFYLILAIGLEVSDSTCMIEPARIAVPLRSARLDGA